MWTHSYYFSAVFFASLGQVYSVSNDLSMSIGMCGGYMTVVVQFKISDILRERVVANLAPNQFYLLSKFHRM